MKRPEILDRAKECVCGQREQDYGSPEDNFHKIANLWTAYFGKEGPTFTALDVAMMMSLLKVARISTGTATDDSFVDLAGYAACGGEIAAKSPEKPRAPFMNYSKQAHSEKPQISNGNHSNQVYGYDEVVFSSREDAEKVLDEMRKLLASWKHVSLATFYELAGFDKTQFTYSHFGWDTLDDAVIARLPSGYTIVFPRPIHFEKESD